MTTYSKVLISSLLLMCTAMSVNAEDNRATGRFAGIPGFSGLSSSSMINLNQAFVGQGANYQGGYYGNYSGDGQLAIVDDIYNPECVVYLQYNQGSGAVQSMAVGTVNVNCN